MKPMSSYERPVDYLEQAERKINDVVDATATEASEMKTKAVKVGKRVVTQMADMLENQFDNLSSTLSKDMGRVKRYVQGQPTKGLAIAFAAGALVSILMRR